MRLGTSVRSLTTPSRVQHGLSVLVHALEPKCHAPGGSRTRHWRESPAEVGGDPNRFRITTRGSAVGARDSAEALTSRGVPRGRPPRPPRGAVEHLGFRSSRDIPLHRAVPQTQLTLCGVSARRCMFPPESEPAKPLPATPPPRCPASIERNYGGYFSSLFDAGPSAIPRGGILCGGLFELRRSCVPF